jgi:hypothetical protein
MGLLSWIRGGRSETDPDDLDQILDEEMETGGDDHDETGANGDEPSESAYTPPAAHARILARVRRDAEADAIRHAEDMLDRQFPITAEAEATATRRLADLHTEFVNRDGELRERRAMRVQQIAAADRRRVAIEAKLRDAGVPADQMDIEPLRVRRFSGWRIVAGLIVGAALGYVVAAADLATIWLILCVAAALALVVALFAAPPEDLEEQEVAALREKHIEVSEVLVQLNSEIARIDIERDALRGGTRTLAEGEVAFAGQMTAAYENAAFSAMPAGSLEGGLEFAAQQEPSVQLPDWALELEVTV